MFQLKCQGSSEKQVAGKAGNVQCGHQWMVLAWGRELRATLVVPPPPSRAREQLSDCSWELLRELQPRHITLIICAAAKSAHV